MRSDYELMVIEAEKKGKGLDKISKKYGVPTVVLEVAKTRLQSDSEVESNEQPNLVGKKRFLTSRVLRLIINTIIVYLVILLIGLMEGVLLA